MEGSVIQATGTVKFEDGLRMGVLPGSLEAVGALRAVITSLGSIPTPPGSSGWSWEQCGCHRNPPVRPNSRSAEFCVLVVLNLSCFVVLGLNRPWDPSLFPVIMELQLLG